jgi:hypothetical protein
MDLMLECFRQAIVAAQANVNADEPINRDVPTLVHDAQIILDWITSQTEPVPDPEPPPVGWGP